MAAGATEPNQGLAPCEFRRWDAGWVCDAAGTPLSAMARPGEGPDAVCRRCAIPVEGARRPCLFLTPVKVAQDGGWVDLFPCHWYHTICRDEMLRTTWLCGGCPDWFPRPPREVNYRFLQRTAVMRAVMERRLAAPAEPPRPPRPAPPPPRARWRRLVAQLLALV